MRLQAFRSSWGVLALADGALANSKYLEIPQMFAAVARLGYDGVEIPVKLALEVGKADLRSMLDDHGLKAVMMAFTDGPVAPAGDLWRAFDGHPAVGPTPADHLAVWKDQVNIAREFDPVAINSHSGNDWWTAAEADEFFAGAQEYDATVLHETHRKRYLHSPWVARDLVQRFPDLRLVGDLSHWVCVAETNPSDPQLTAVIERLAPNFHHLHARVGYDHGPQVVDPRVEPWREYLDGHLAWWRAIWRAQAARGAEVSTFTPEHGPPNYQISHHGKPLADIWEVNHFVARTVAAAFAEEFGADNSVDLAPLEE